MRLPTKITPETIIKRQVKDYLNWCGWYHFPLTAGMGSMPGIPDRYAIKNGRQIWIEVKAPKGKQSYHQKEFQDMIESQGGEYLLCRCLEDLMDRLIVDFQRSPARAF